MPEDDREAVVRSVEAEIARTYYQNEPEPSNDVGMESATDADASSEAGPEADPSPKGA
ncbi:MAG: hypothetical protein AAF108_03670 [Planctomycetota bacterium]